MNSYLHEFLQMTAWILPFTLLNIAGLFICLRYTKTAGKPAKFGVAAFSIYLGQQILSSAFRAWLSLSFIGLSPMSKVDSAQMASRGFLVLSLISATAAVFLLLSLIHAFKAIAASTAPNPALNSDAASTGNLPHRYF